jgi:hypothetical protein
MIQPDPQIRCMCLEDPRFGEARDTLLALKSGVDAPLSATFWEGLKQQKISALASGDQAAAKACWCLEEVGRAQEHFVLGFAAAKRDDFHTFWCDLERVETALHFLEPHYATSLPDFGLRHLSLHVPRFQELFPYRLFFSPGMVVKRFICSICGQPMKLRGGCAHINGEIYNGEICCRVLKDIQLLEVSIVENPVQKYSVLFGPDIAYDYGPVRYVVQGLRSPWHEWRCEISEIVEASERFPGTSPDAGCPCESGQHYEDCCRRKPRVRRHYEVLFAVVPPPELAAGTTSWSFIVKGNPVAKPQDTTGDAAQRAAAGDGQERAGPEPQH